jgi:hypothetical protein
VPGGVGNTAQGAHSFAAGRRAKANNDGCFVWGDATDSDVTCADDNRTIFRSSGGFYVFTNSSQTTGMYLPADSSGPWQPVPAPSDRNLKENFQAVDSVELLERLVTAVPITTWNYKAEDPAVRHLGPMAQDFHAAFGLGSDDKTIGSLDADGVALAAIQGLYELVEEKDARIESLESENAAQQTQIDDLEARLAALEAGASDRSPGRTSLPRGLWAGLLPGAGILLLALGLVLQRRKGGAG